jgi:hypothetical protein
MTLKERTEVLLTQRLKSRPRMVALREIADSSDGQVNLEWLKRFARGEIDNPGVNTIQSLHDCLIKSPTSHA